MNAIRQSARRMGDFSGRDRRSRFWPYAGVVVGVWFLLYAVAFTLMTVVALTASETVFMVTVFGAMAFFILLLIGLLAAAFDSGDGLHPSAAGYRAMAEAIPLTLFGR